jgi:hypothetical protein
VDADAGAGAGGIGAGNPALQCCINPTGAIHATTPFQSSVSQSLPSVPKSTAAGLPWVLDLSSHPDAKVSMLFGSAPESGSSVDGSGRPVLGSSAIPTTCAPSHDPTSP